MQGRTRFHAIAAITAGLRGARGPGGSKAGLGGYGGDSCPLCWPRSSAAPAVGAPPGSGLEAAGDTAALCRCRGPAGIPQSGRAAQRTPNLSLWCLPQTQEGLAAGSSGVSLKRGWRYPSPTEPRSPRAVHSGAVCPPAAAVAARKCLHGDGRSRAQGWRNTSGSGWWGEGPSGEGAPVMGDGNGYSLSASEREAFELRPHGSVALVATAMRGRPGCGTRGDVAQSV